MREIKAAILDWNRTLVKGEDSSPVFYSEVPDVLKMLKNKGLLMGIVSAGGQDPAKRWQDFDGLGLRDLGVTEFTVVGPNDPKDLSPMIKKFNVKPEECVVVGDRISKEIVEGNKIGATTIRVQRPGDKFADDKPETKDQEPDYTIPSLNELPQIIEDLSS